MKLYFPDLVGNHSKFSAFGCLGSVANKKGVYLEKKHLIKKSSNRKINLQFAKI